MEHGGKGRGRGGEDEGAGVVEADLLPFLPEGESLDGGGGGSLGWGVESQEGAAVGGRGEAAAQVLREVEEAVIGEGVFVGGGVDTSPVMLLLRGRGEGGGVRGGVEEGGLVRGGQGLVADGSGGGRNG